MARLLFGEGREAEIKAYVKGVFDKFDDNHSGALSFSGNWESSSLKITKLHNLKSSLNWCHPRVRESRVYRGPDRFLQQRGQNHEGRVRRHFELGQRGDGK